MSDETIREEAKKLLHELQEFYGIYKEVDLIPILYKDSEYVVGTLQNRLSEIKNKKCAINFTNQFIRIAKAHKKYISIDYSDIYNFFIENKVCDRLKQDKYQKIEGLYLLLRHSNTVDNKILVSYLDVNFENNTLLFKSERNNLYTKQDRYVPICIETDGMISRNTFCSYFGMGISRNIADGDVKTFAETFVIYKNERGSNDPIVGYWSGNIVSNNNKDPFLSKIILIKIKNPESEKEIRSGIKRLSYGLSIFRSNELIKLHTKEDLSKNDGVFYKIINTEKFGNLPEKSMLPTQTTEETIDHILNGLDITVDKNKNVIHLDGFC